jgi:hypothetical protein
MSRTAACSTMLRIKKRCATPFASERGTTLTRDSPVDAAYLDDLVLRAAARAVGAAQELDVAAAVLRPSTVAALLRLRTHHTVSITSNCARSQPRAPTTACTPPRIPTLSTRTADHQTTTETLANSTNTRSASHICGSAAPTRSPRGPSASRKWWCVVRRWRCARVRGLGGPPGGRMRSVQRRTILCRVRGELQPEKNDRLRATWFLCGSHLPSQSARLQPGDSWRGSRQRLRDAPWVHRHWRRYYRCGPTLSDPERTRRSQPSLPARQRRESRRAC